MRKQNLKMSNRENRMFKSALKKNRFNLIYIASNIMFRELYSRSLEKQYPQSEQDRVFHLWSQVEKDLETATLLDLVHPEDREKARKRAMGISETLNEGYPQFNIILENTGKFIYENEDLAQKRQEDLKKSCQVRFAQAVNHRKNSLAKRNDLH